MADLSFCTPVCHLTTGAAGELKATGQVSDFPLQTFTPASGQPADTGAIYLRPGARCPADAGATVASANRRSRAEMNEQIVSPVEKALMGAAKITEITGPRI